MPTEDKNFPVMRSVGLMSGTSMDGIDGALLETDGLAQIKMGGVYSLIYPKPFHHALKMAEYAVRFHQGGLEKAAENFDTHMHEYIHKMGADALSIHDDIRDYFGFIPQFQDVIDHLTDLHAKVVENLLDQENVNAQDVNVVGFHGQTMYHNPSINVTRQLGNAERLADRLKIPVVSNFRENDVLHGGQGAPFAPLYHQALAVRDNLVPCALVNCGGISNVTFVWGPNADQLMGFDTGPGNGLVDRYTKEQTKGNETYDKDGHYGLQGRVDPVALGVLKASLKTFMDKKPPKSLDISDFDYGTGLEGVSMVDAVRTLEELTAQCVVEGLRWLSEGAPAPQRWILGGGGWKNPVIRSAFENNIKEIHSDVCIQDVNNLGWNNDGLEAQIFAYLAVRSLNGFPLSVPSVTGGSAPLTGGVLTYPEIKKTHFKGAGQKN